MQKYGIKITNGNDYRIVGTFETLDDAMKNGKEVYNQISSKSETVSCIFAEFDENNNIVNNKYKLYKVWF